MTSLDAVRYKKELRRLGLISNFRGKVGNGRNTAKHHSIQLYYLRAQSTASNKFMPHSRPQQNQKGSTNTGPVGTMILGERQEKQYQSHSPPINPGRQTFGTTIGQHQEHSG